MSTRDELAAAVVAAIDAALPDARRNIKWNAPNWSIDGRDLVTLNLPPKGGVRVILHRGARAVDSKSGSRLLADDSGRLQWASDQRAIVAFADRADFDRAAEWLARTCRDWVDLA